MLTELLEQIDQHEFKKLSHDIKEVINQHLMWLNQLNSALLTPSSERSLQLHDRCAYNHCAFGRWLNQLLALRCFQHPFFENLHRLHIQFHICASDLLAEQDAAGQFQAAHYAQLLSLQQQLFDQLMTLFEFSVMIKNQFDSTTGLMNRRSVNTVLAYEKYRMQRSPTSRCCIALVDIDHFKKVNDQYGHDVGDRVLREVAERLQSITRGADTIARYGGEEFLFVLPNMRLSEAVTGMERVRKDLARNPIAELQPELWISASFGITQLCAECDIEQSLKRADLALYAAKMAGRNRCACIDIERFSEQDRAISRGAINETFSAVVNDYCQIVNSGTRS